jgi:hypothetical protein
MTYTHPLHFFSLVTYHWRANAIRKRGSGPYDDRLGALAFGWEQRLKQKLTTSYILTGPTVLCIALLAAIVINFILRVSRFLHSPPNLSSFIAITQFTESS